MYHPKKKNKIWSLFQQRDNTIQSRINEDVNVMFQFSVLLGDIKKINK